VLARRKQALVIEFPETKLLPSLVLRTYIG